MTCFFLSWLVAAVGLVISICGSHLFSPSLRELSLPTKDILTYFCFLVHCYLPGNFCICNTVLLLLCIWEPKSFEIWTFFPYWLGEQSELIADAALSKFKGQVQSSQVLPCILLISDLSILFKNRGRSNYMDGFSSSESCIICYAECLQSPTLWDIRACYVNIEYMSLYHHLTYHNYYRHSL